MKQRTVDSLLGKKIVKYLIYLYRNFNFGIFRKFLAFNIKISPTRLADKNKFFRKIKTGRKFKKSSSDTKENVTISRKITKNIKVGI